MQSLEYYSKTSFGKPNPSGESVIDVLIKLIRVIANMSVNNEVGFGLGTRQSLGSVLLSLILTINTYKNNLVSCLYKKDRVIFTNHLVCLRIEFGHGRITAGHSGSPA